MQNTSSQLPPPAMVWWTLWGAFQIGIIFIFYFLGQSATPGRHPEPGPWALALIPVLISGALRWSLLPNIRDASRAFPIFVMGIAIAEATCFIGLFIFPSHKLLLFLAAFAGIFQYMPVYVGRFTKPGSPE